VQLAPRGDVLLLPHVEIRLQPLAVHRAGIRPAEEARQVGGVRAEAGVVGPAVVDQGQASRRSCSTTTCSRSGPTPMAEMRAPLIRSMAIT
jgi:hypothetical protein